MAKCEACGRFLKGGVVCPRCKSVSHHECVRVPEGAQVADSWRCGACQASAPKGRDPSTPIRPAHQDYCVEEQPAALDDTTHNITADFTEQQLRTLRSDMLSEFSAMQQNLVTDLNSFKTEFRTMFTEWREFRAEMVELRVSLAGMAQRMDGFERRLEDVERRAAAPGAAGEEVAALERTVAELKRELNERDQDALLSDLEIGQLPEERGESVLHTVTVLAAKLGVQLEERDVVFAERVSAVQAAGPAGEAPRARRVVVRLARRDLRDRLLQGARVRRTLTAADAGRAADPAPASPRIFINERLSRTNKQLFHRVREECRRAGWRFSWTRRGRIYARQGEGKPAYPIRTEADVARVFGPV